MAYTLPTFEDNNRPTFARIVHASAYHEDAKGVMIEVVEWDRCFAFCETQGDFNNGPWHTPIPTWYSLKAAAKVASKEFERYVVAL